MKISFEGHQGLLWIQDNTVIFYGVRFKNISEATRMTLRYIKPSVSYRPWCSGRHRGIKDGLSGKIFVQERWFDNEKVTELYLKHITY
jgi:hypothetical protein